MPKQDDIAEPQDEEATRLLPRAARPALLLPGTLLGNTYVIEELLGRGGMGEVYRARHAELGTEHAIKIILPSLADDPKIVQLFLEEARKLGRVKHNAIVEYQGFLRDEHGLRYLVTEFVRGESLAQVLRRRRLEPDEVLRLRNRLALGLATAHEMDIVHRDVSPENILLPEGSVDRAKLIDFGIAKSMDPSSASVIGTDFAGKYSYVSPEQAGLFGGRVDLRSDIYSLGLVLAAAAIGFGKKLDMGSTPATMIAARQKVPDLTAVPTSLRPIIAPMLEPRPDDRPPSMRALLSNGNYVPREAPPSAYAPRVRLWKHRTIFAAVAAVVAAGVIGALILFQSVKPPPSIDELRTRLTAVAADYQCSSVAYSIGADRSVRVTGFAANREDIDRLHNAIERVGGISKLTFELGVRIWPYCEIVSILENLMKQPPKISASLSLLPAGEEMHLGEPLIVDIRMPGFDGFIYVDYFDAEGNVLHLFPNDRDKINFKPARAHVVLGKPPFARCWTLGGNTGEQLVTLVAATRQLFPDQRYEVENARDYLPKLSEAINRLPEGEAAATSLFFQLRDAVPFGSPADPCPAS